MSKKVNVKFLPAISPKPHTKTQSRQGRRSTDYTDWARKEAQSESLSSSLCVPCDSAPLREVFSRNSSSTGSYPFPR